MATLARLLASVTVVATIAVAATAVPAQPLPDPVPRDTWGPTGTVSAVTRQGDVLFIGGSFTYVGPGTGLVPR